MLKQTRGSKTFVEHVCGLLKRDKIFEPLPVRVWLYNERLNICIYYCTGTLTYLQVFKIRVELKNKKLTHSDIGYQPSPLDEYPVEFFQKFFFFYCSLISLFNGKFLFDCPKDEARLIEGLESSGRNLNFISRLEIYFGQQLLGTNQV